MKGESEDDRRVWRERTRREERKRRKEEGKEGGREGGRERDNSALMSKMTLYTCTCNWLRAFIIVVCRKSRMTFPSMITQNPRARTSSLHSRH